MNIQNELQNKKIAVVGVSVEGLETVKYLSKFGLSVTVCDKKNKAELGTIYQILVKLGVKLSLDNNYLQELKNFDIVFRTPGMPLWTREIMDAKDSGVVITSQTKFFFDHCPCPIIGITGTKGKGTTTTLIFEILKKAGKKVFIGGNIGQPPLSFIDQLEPSSYAVLELSSFQLEDLDKSPHVAVVLMTTQEHLASASRENPNYHRSVEVYRAAKANIVLHQMKGDFTIINADSPHSRLMAKKTKAQVYFFSKEYPVRGIYLKDRNNLITIHINGKDIFIGDVSKAILKGRHNRENMMAAALTGYLLGIDKEIIFSVLMSFEGLEHRLEFVKTIHGVEYYNDTFSTTPEPAIAAIRAFPDKSIILIAGGSDKGSDYSELGKTIVNSPVKSIILIGDMAEQIEQAIKIAGGGKEIIHLNKNPMEDIVKRAAEKGVQGDIVLLSPGCASFDMFKNYKERGRSFKDAVLAL